MNLKTDSDLKESTPGEIKRHKEQIAGLIGSLKDIFHGVAQNVAADAELPGNGLLSARKYGTERVESNMICSPLGQTLQVLRKKTPLIPIYTHF